MIRPEAHGPRTEASARVQKHRGKQGEDEVENCRVTINRPSPQVSTSVGFGWSAPLGLASLVVQTCVRRADPSPPARCHWGRSRGRRFPQGSHSARIAALRRLSQLQMRNLQSGSTLARKALPLEVGSVGVGRCTDDRHPPHYNRASSGCIGAHLSLLYRALFDGVCLNGTTP